jgi:ABC-type Fe3+-hydroxamate transport system substrate-binding protein
MRNEGIIDIRGVAFEPLRRPVRVVSLVPCWTETLFHLGLIEKEIVGRTPYCVHPRGRVDGIESIGGPKDPNMERIIDLDPNLIIVDREENRREDVERVENHWTPSRVFTTGPTTVKEALDDLQKFGRLLDAQKLARELVGEVEFWLNRLAPEERGTAAYLVWQDPLMVATRETYIGNVLEKLGYRNVFDRSTTEELSLNANSGYPQVTVHLLDQLKPDFIFLSTEPFPFRRGHIERLLTRLRALDREYAERVDIQIVNGEFFSWYGSRMVYAFRYFVRHRLRN